MSAFYCFFGDRKTNKTNKSVTFSKNITTKYNTFKVGVAYN